MNREGSLWLFSYNFKLLLSFSLPERLHMGLDMHTRYIQKISTNSLKIYGSTPAIIRSKLIGASKKERICLSKRIDLISFQYFMELEG